MRGEGVVRDADGRPVFGVGIAAWDEAAGSWVPRSGTLNDGTWQLTVPGPTWVTTLPFPPTAPPAQCVGIPSEFTFDQPEGLTVRHVVSGNDFLVPPMCAWRFSMGADREILDVGVARGDTRATLRLPVVDGWASTFLPCDLDAVQAAAGAEVSVAVGDCGHPGATCLTQRGGDVSLAARPGRRMQLRVSDGDDRPVDLALVHTGLLELVVEDGEASLVIPPGVPARVDAPGRLPALLPASGDPIRAELEVVGELVRARVTLADARDVSVLEAPTGRATVCAAADGSAQEAPPCASDPASPGRLSCICPAGPAVLLPASPAVAVAADATEVRWPVGTHTASITLQAPAPCTVRAVHQPGQWEAWTSEPEPPRDLACGAEGVTLTALRPGTWAIELVTPGGVWRDHVSVAGEPIDLGEVELAASAP